MSSEKQQKLPIILTLCNGCNKEFPIQFEENNSGYCVVFAVCPHCKKANHRWLRIPKRKKAKK